MKFTNSVIIDRPLDWVVALWENEQYYDQWQDGFESITLLEGEKNHVDSKSRILFSHGNTRMELIETILVANLPAEKTGLYVHKHMTNTSTTRFRPVSDDVTEYIVEIEYTQFNGWLVKLMAALFPGRFKNQSLKWMKQFKSFAESHST